MSNAAKMVELVKRAALDAVSNTMPSGVYYGTVTSASPLKINVESKMVLTEKQLLLSSLVRDFDVDMSAGDNDTSLASDSPFGSEKRSVKNHFALKSGEKVMLLRVQGGQQYIVLDRVREAK